MLLSLVIPSYNEAEGIKKFHTDLLMPSLEALQSEYEIIYVNDGSTDDTLTELTTIARGNKNVRVINLSRNFGKEMATTAGITASSGDATLIMDSDGQHPPEMISEFVNKWQEGFQVVVGIRESNQKEGLVKKMGSMVFYKLFNTTTNSKMVPRSTDFRLIDKVVREEFVKFSERNRITRGLIDWLGFKRAYLEFHSPERLAGQASYGTGQLIRLAVNSFTTLSLRPLFFFGWIGAAITMLSLVGGITIFIEQFIFSDPYALNFTGTALLGIFISFLVGIVLMSQGMLALYLSHIYGQTQGRPLYVIDTVHSVNLEQK